MTPKTFLAATALGLALLSCRSVDHHGNLEQALDEHGRAVAPIVTKSSPHSVPKTLDRLEAALTAKGLTVFTRIDHGAGAAKVNIPLPATQILIFGNPKVGTPLMVENRNVGLDLPLKAMAWEDDKGQVWLSYTAPATLAKRFDITENAAVISKMTQALEGLTSKAIEFE